MFSFIEKKVIKQFNLQPAIDYRNQYNKSGKLLYHNNQHMDFVLQDCIEYYLHEQITKTSSSVVYSPRPLFFAAIFHDVNHSGGERTDDLNIQEALSFWQEYCFSHPEINAYELSSVEWLIRATQYPYLELNVSLPPPFFQVYEFAAVLRDADLMTIYHGIDGLVMSSLYLFQEMSVHKEMTYQQYVDGNTKFLREVCWGTKWAKEKADLLWDSRLNNTILKMNDLLPQFSQEDKT